MMNQSGTCGDDIFILDFARVLLFENRTTLSRLILSRESYCQQWRFATQLSQCIWQRGGGDWILDFESQDLTYSMYIL